MWTRLLLVLITVNACTSVSGSRALPRSDRPAVRGDGVAVETTAPTSARDLDTRDPSEAFGSAEAMAAAEAKGLTPILRVDDEPTPPPATIREAIQQGRTWFKFRIRAETVDQSGIDKDAKALTARTVIGYETAELHGFKGVVEVENVSRIGGRQYNTTENGRTQYPVVADPSGTEVNQAYLQKTLEWATIKGGRQVIILDNARFIGNVGWRQNEQTFDAVSTTIDAGGHVDVHLSWLANANRIFGDDSSMGDARMSSYLLNVGTAVGDHGRLVAYWYDLDYNSSSDMTALSTQTLGGRYKGALKASDDAAPVDFLLEYAHQTDTGKNPNRVNADYHHVMLGVPVGPVKIEAGQEVLEGSESNSGAFTTPLATLHAFNGWADKFLTTPTTGLEDNYVSIGGKISDTKLKAVYHNFHSEASSRDFGSELDLLIVTPLDEDSTWGAKYADFNAEDFATDTEKFWLWYETRF